MEMDYVRWMLDSDLEDTLTIGRETAQDLLTDERIELLEEISKENISSVRELSEQVDRDISEVNSDLDPLFKAEVIDLEINGNTKRPVLSHENIMIRPIVFDGDVLKSRG